MPWLARLALPWSIASWWQPILDRTRPAADGWASSAPLSTATFSVGPLTGPAVWVALGIGLAAVVIPPVWRATRIVVTFVHELGHAVVGMLMGRRFTGFVVRSDMSGHAVTVGKRRGFGMIATTWAGYPAPALVAWGLVWAAQSGWAPAVLGVAALGCVFSLVFVRSWATAGTTLVLGLAAGALWWWRDDARSAAVLLAVAVVLLLGAWRHVFAVAGAPKGSDPAELARITPLPGWFWVGTQMLAIAGASYGCWVEVMPAVGW